MALAYGVAPPKLLISHGKQPNAFVTLDKDKQPLLVMNTEMLRLVGHDANLTAAVVGHELGHLTGAHLTDGAGKEGLTALFGFLAGFAFDMSQARRGVDTGGLGMQLGNAGSGLVNAKFSRDQEREADELGIRAMVRAGFDPGQCPSCGARWNPVTKEGTACGCLRIRATTSASVLCKRWPLRWQRLLFSQRRHSLQTLNLG